MTDNEIIKALECCVTQPVCDGCPMRNHCKDLKPSEFYKIILDLINRQKEEIERLKQENFDMSLTVEIWKTEAVKEFAERLKEKAWHGMWETINHVDVDEIDNLVKEMVGEG